MTIEKNFCAVVPSAKGRSSTDQTISAAPQAWAHL